MSESNTSSYSSSEQYIRIGTSYYKTVRKPLSSGDLMTMLLPWSPECIRQDHGKSFLSEIPKYDGFCFVPSHLDYQRIVRFDEGMMRAK